MRFFTRAAPTVLPCARRGGLVTSVTTGDAGATTRSARSARSASGSARSSAVGSTRTGGESPRLERVAPETSWEF